MRYRLKLINKHTIRSNLTLQISTKIENIYDSKYSNTGIRFLGLKEKTKVHPNTNGNRAHIGDKRFGCVFDVATTKEAKTTNKFEQNIKKGKSSGKELLFRIVHKNLVKEYFIN
ncbi:hypothetical protein CWI38_0761p0030 [Hamiltosporidium tvaerminnensis]|uniref:Uncharacterized protein n=1 Tax=Hamiltosporidium tvaerminnensis TaxID=1176355 RepID=A0A4Q9LVX9_9MICR|nr:hypothetical protein CWI38_0761p0030 [Hamiltosporidium tvaerminnensis]